MIQTGDEIWYEWLNMFTLIDGTADMFTIEQIQAITNSSNIVLLFIYISLFFYEGLPVTIARAGLLPFLISFLIGFFVQVIN